MFWVAVGLKFEPETFWIVLGRLFQLDNLAVNRVMFLIRVHTQDDGAVFFLAAFLGRDGQDL